MDILRKYLKIGGLTLAGMGGFGLLMALGIYLYITPKLPSVESLKDTQFQVPLRIYSSDGKLIQEYGEKRRTPLDYAEMPPLMIQAVLGAEDDRFFEHPGVDYQGLVRAVALLILTGQKVQGGSTITMQVARNFFLSREKTFLRKFSEILLALKIEKELTKEEILELYLNKIYLGNRAYGVAAAAKVYYGKTIDELTVAELAMVAGLPKAPSRYNPIVNPTRALLRRNYVLGRMRTLGSIDEELYNESVLQPVTAELHSQSIEVEAPYAAEMVRLEMVDRFGNEAYTKGYRVYTTVDSRLQEQANVALRRALLDYETRHGYRGPVSRLDVMDAFDQQDWEELLDPVEVHPMLENGVVIEVEDKSVLVFLNDGQGEGQIVSVCWKGLSWAAPKIGENSVGRAPRTAADILQTGDIVRLFRAGRIWMLGQVPEVEGALVSLRSRDGAVISIVGGFDFYRSKFNRATQAIRQPGSNIKPFVYSAALEKGFTAASRINDAPVVFDDPGLEDTWRPENYSGKFFGPTRMREALVKSRNLVSIRLLRSIGVNYALDHIGRFGIDVSHLPHDLSLALGSASMTPFEVVRGYAVFSNGGFLIEPHIITRIESDEGEVLFEANPPVVCESCLEERERKQAQLAAMEAIEGESGGALGEPMDAIPVGGDNASDEELSNIDEEATGLFEAEPEIKLAERAVSPQNVYIMTTIMQDIVKRGTGRRALVLRRNDLAGKTGTTNDQLDAWFSGFNAEVATTAWVGFDTPRPLGDRESGARAALPMWISFMREALRGVKDKPLVQPEGIVTVRIDPETGLLAGSDVPDAMFEIFREEYAPRQSSGQAGGGDGSNGDDGGDITNLF